MTPMRTCATSILCSTLLLGASVARADGGVCVSHLEKSDATGWASLVSPTEVSVVRAEDDRQVWQKVTVVPGQPPQTTELAQFDRKLAKKSGWLAAAGTTRQIIWAAEQDALFEVAVFDVIPGHVTRIDSQFPAALATHFAFASDGTAFAVNCTQQGTAADVVVQHSPPSAPAVWSRVGTGHFEDTNCQFLEIAALNATRAAVLAGKSIYQTIDGGLEPMVQWTQDSPKLGNYRLVIGPDDLPVIWWWDEDHTQQQEATPVLVERIAVNPAAGTQTASLAIEDARAGRFSVLRAEAGSLLMETRTPDGHAALTTLRFSEGALTVSASVPIETVTALAVADATVDGGVAALTLDAVEAQSAEGYGPEWRYSLHQLDGSQWRETSLGTLAYERSRMVKPDICRACGCSGASSTSVALVLVVWWMARRRRPALTLG